MLTVGLTGGIGSGKSMVAAELARLGAAVVDADVVAREVVEPGTTTLEAIASRFGRHMIREDGSLDRAALAALVFPDPAALADLNAITAPAITARVEERRRALPDDRVSVFDMPLLVERRLWPQEHLTIVVGADVETRVRRLVDQRGLGEEDARHRVAAQATDAQRRAAADVWVDNDGSREQTLAHVGRVWRDRLLPYDENLRTGHRSQRPEQGAVVDPDPGWTAEGARLVAKVADALGDRATDVEHVGSTSVPGLLAKDVIDLQVGVRRMADADAPAFVDGLRRRGFLRIGEVVQDTPHPRDSDPAAWTKRFFASMDPVRVANLHVREHGSPGWLFALQFRDWLRAEPGEVAAYAAEKRRLVAVTDSTTEYAAAKEPWFGAAYPRMDAWADGRHRAPSTR
ncbi:MAG: dephospho-CoA kinase [Lapillicoccus sp.]